MTTDPLPGRTRTDPAPPPPPVLEVPDAPGSGDDYELLYPGPGLPIEPPAESPRRHWRLGPRSLTGRLVAGVVTVVIVVVLSAGIGTYYALRSFLYERLDQQLGSTVSSVRSITTLFNRSPATAPGVHAPQDVWAVALDPDGAVLTNPGSSSVEAMKLSAADRIRIAQMQSNAVITVTTEDGVQLRATSRPVPVDTGQGIVPGVAVIGLSTAEIHRTLSHVLKLELAIGGSAVVLALLATTYGVRFSLRRLHGVTRTAQDVAAELSPDGAGLDRRVPVTEPGTEVGQLAESMNTLLAAVETQFAARLESERRMAQFLADASHELRTPLTSIRGYAELARMQRAVGGTQEDNLERIESEGTRMSRLVEDLLTLARGDQGSMPERELVDVTELLGDAASGARAAFPLRQIDVDAATGQHLIGDHDQLLRVVRNLVTNAAVHTRPDGPIRLRAFPDGPGVAVQVVDAGPGLPPDEAAHVFERFWRADKARTRVRGGSGLGLAIVASIVTAHGGTVHFQSTVELGSTVTVWLPVGTL